MSSAPSISIIRLPQRQNFTTVDNAVLQGGYLTPEAIGLFVYLLSRPPNWTISIAQLAAQLKSGRDKIQRIMNELRDAGHAKLRTIQGDKGQFGGKRWEVSESRDGFASAAPIVESRQPENPVVGAPAESLKTRPSENRPVNRQKTDLNKTTPQSPPNREAADAGPTFEAFERVYPFGDADPCGASRQFARLRPDERRKVLAHAPAYVADRKARRLTVATPQAYLRSRLWEGSSGIRRETASFAPSRPARQGLTGASPDSGSGVCERRDGTWFVRPDTKNYAAWRDYDLRAGIHRPSLIRPAPWPPGFAATAVRTAA